MTKDKRDIIAEYKQFCQRNCLVESVETASFFAERYLNKATKINSQRIVTLYNYVGG